MKLEDVCELIVDCPHSTANDEGNGFPLIRTPNIGKGRLILEGVHRVSQEVYDKRNLRAVPQDDDLIFARKAPAGNVAVIKNGEKVCLGQRTVLLRPNKALVNPDFLAYYLLSPQQQYGLLGTANGATVAHVNIPTVRNLKIDVPDLDKQVKIASIISSYDNLIENNQKQIKLLEEAAQRLYKEWFVVDDIPKGWEQRSLGDVASVLKRGISPKYDDSGKYLVISQKCIRQSIMDIGEARRESKEYAPELNLQDKDTVICSTGTGTLGRVGQVFGAYPDTTFDSHVTLVRTEQYQNFFYQAIKHQQDFLMSMGRGSTNQQELYRGVIENLRILTPTQEILNKAESLFSTIHDKITALNSQIGLLVEARDRLLPKLMSGEVEVKSQRHKGVIP